VSLCNLGGQCVTVQAGFTSTTRGGQPPTQPVPTPPAVAAENLQSTSFTGSAATGAGAAATTEAPPAAATSVPASAPAGIASSSTVVGSAGPSTSASVHGVALQQGSNIFSGDVVEVGPGGEGVVTFGHNAMARVSEQSAVQATRGTRNSVGLNLLRGRMVFRTTPEQPVSGSFADAQVISQNGQEAVAIVSYRNPQLVSVTSERGTLSLTAGTERRTVSVPEGQTVEVTLSGAPPSGANPSAQQATGAVANASSKAALVSAGVAAAAGAAIGPVVAAERTCTQKGAPVSPSTFPCP